MNYIKGYKRKIIVLIITLFWMAVIFMFSNQTGDSSSGISDKIVNGAIDIFVPKYDSMPSDEKKQIFSTLSLIVRKSAHITEYAILAVLVYLFFLEKNWWFRYFLPVAFVMFYAATDEIHQTFVSGRSGNVIDVGIDTLGAVLIMTLISIVHLIIKRIKKEKVNKVLHSELF